MTENNRLLRRGRLAVGAAALLVCAVTTLTTSAWAAHPAGGDSAAVPADPAWVDSVTTNKQEIQPGVDLLTLKWGSTDADDHWYVLAYLPADPSGPLATATMALGPKATADHVAQALSDAGYAPSVDLVSTPDFADAPASRLGWTVKVGSFATSAEANAELAELKAAGFTGQSRYSAEDGSDANAPQAGYVLRVDFDTYQGRLVSEHGPDLATHENLTDLVTMTGAIAGINDAWAYREAIAGLYVKDGRVLGSTTQGRGGVLVRDGGRTVDVDRYTGHFWLGVGRETVEVDGVNRVPGRIQNCGGIGGDLPWSVAQHDRVCTDDSELVRFTPVWGATPSGTGAEIVVDSRSRVVAVNQSRGTMVPAGGSTIQGTGESAEWLLHAVHVGQKVDWREEIRDSSGTKVNLTSDTTISQVGPVLVDEGKIAVDARADGLLWEGVNPSFTYNWVLRSNPRSAIGMDDQGRLLLAVFDGRQPGYAAGLGILDEAKIMRRFGATEALNLDGGGSSVIATSAGIVNSPSDAGHIQRPQNDGWLLTP